jgi:hypothetical protein
MTEQRSFDWYLNCALASVTTLMLVVALVLNILALYFGDAFLAESVRGLQLSRLTGFALLVVVLSLFWFWGRMLNDYFRNRPKKNAVAWGWALFLLSVVAALAYFWLVWLPRNGHMHRAAA